MDTFKTKASLDVGGTMSFKIVDEDEIVMNYQQSNGPHGFGYVYGRVGAAPTQRAPATVTVSTASTPPTSQPAPTTTAPPATTTGAGAGAVNDAALADALAASAGHAAEAASIRSAEARLATWAVIADTPEVVTVRQPRELLILGACLAAACAGIASASSSGAALAAPGPGMSVHLPLGWVSRQLPGGGLTAASRPADLGVMLPAGPELTIQPITLSAFNAAGLLASTDRAPFVGSITTYRTSVAGKKALYLQWTVAEKSGNETTRVYVVTLGQGRAFSFRLEAAASEWTAGNPAFDKIMASVTFG